MEDSNLYKAKNERKVNIQEINMKNIEMVVIVFAIITSRQLAYPQIAQPNVVISKETIPDTASQFTAALQGDVYRLFPEQTEEYSTGKSLQKKPVKERERSGIYSLKCRMSPIIFLIKEHENI